MCPFESLESKFPVPQPTSRIASSGLDEVSFTNLPLTYFSFFNHSLKHHIMALADETLKAECNDYDYQISFHDLAISTLSSIKSNFDRT